MRPCNLIVHKLTGKHECHVDSTLELLSKAFTRLILPSTARHVVDNNLNQSVPLGMRLVAKSKGPFQESVINRAGQEYEDVGIYSWNCFQV